MQWNLAYDYCALIGLAFFSIYYFSSRRIKNRLNKLYVHLSIITIATIILDIVAGHSIMMLGSTPWPGGISMSYFLNCLYFIALDCDLYIFARYMYYYTEHQFRGRRGVILGVLPISVSLLLAILTPFAEPLSLFRISVNEGKVEYNLMGVPYIIHMTIFAVYMIGATVLLINYRKKLSRMRLSAMICCMLLLWTSALLQVILGQILRSDVPSLLGVGMAFSIIAIYLGQYNAGDSIDSSTNAFNKKTFYLSTSEYIDSKHPFSVIAFEPDNFNEVVRKYGDDKANFILKEISEFLHELVHQQAIFKLDGNIFAILLGENDKYVNEETFVKYYYASHVFQGSGMGDSEEARIVLQAISERFDHVWNMGDDKVRLSACISYLRYPEDVTRADEVNDMIDAAIRQAHTVGNGIILYASEYTQTRETYINELQSKQAELEEATRVAEEARATAERADNSKTKFLANMSHEIRTPMNAIMGMTELVLRDEINDQVRKNVNNIQSAGNTLLTIINDILDFSKIEAGKMEVVEGGYEIGSLLNNVLSVSAARLNGKKLELIVDVDPTLPSKFRGDEMRLRQVIINLMGNAIKYTEQGSVTLKMSWERIENLASSVEDSEVNLIVSVIDTGSGIREEDLNKLFKSFSRIEEEKNHLIEGTGLGLSIVKRLLDLMSGTITVESEYGKGSNFTFRIPQKIESSMSFAHVAEPETKSVLIYSETASVHKALGAVLDSLKVMHAVALSNEELVQAMEAQKFTHIFVEYSRYSSVWELLSKMSDVKVVLLLRGNQIADNQPDSVYIRQPFYCLNVAEALNDTQKKEEKKTKREYFKAPDAKILIVDDNAINLQILAGLLQPHNMQVDSAESGKTCLKLVQENAYDLILMDHMMPEMDGVETLRAIRAMEGDYYQKVPVVVVTANAMSGVQEAMDEAGFQGYISKPINVDKLENTLLDFIPLDKIRNTAGDDTKAGQVISLFIPGLNIHKGIANNGGRLQNYIAVLNTFLIEGNKRLQKFEACVRDDDYRKYESEAHELKIVADGIGAEILADMSREQEKSCREGVFADVKITHSRYLDIYRNLLSNIDEAIRDTKGILSTSDMPERGLWSDAEALEQLAVIYGLFVTGERDLAERRIKEGNEYAMNNNFKNTFIDLKTHMDLRNFEEAEIYLKEELQKLRKQTEA